RLRREHAAVDGVAARQPAGDLRRACGGAGRRPQLDHRRPPGTAGQAAGDRPGRAAARGLAGGRRRDSGGGGRAGAGLQPAQPRLPGALPLRAGAAVRPLRGLRPWWLHARRVRTQRRLAAARRVLAARQRATPRQAVVPVRAVAGYFLIHGSFWTRRTASMRLLTLSLPRIDETWWSTVRRERQSCWEISLFVAPSSMSARTSCSRLVRPSGWVRAVR